MKKMTAVLLSVFISASMLTGCGTDNSGYNEWPDPEIEVVTDNTQTSTTVSDQKPSAKLVPGIYYDKYTYEEQGVFWCVVLREDGNAFIGMENIANSVIWDSDGTITIFDWDVKWECEVVGDELIFKDQGFSYFRAGDDVIPENIRSYYENGAFADVERDELGYHIDFEAELIGDYSVENLSDYSKVIYDHDEGVGLYLANGDIVFDNSSASGVVAFDKKSAFAQIINVTDAMKELRGLDTTNEEWLNDYINSKLLDEISALYGENGIIGECSMLEGDAKTCAKCSTRVETVNYTIKAETSVVYDIDEDQYYLITYYWIDGCVLSEEFIKSVEGFIVKENW